MECIKNCKTVIDADCPRCDNYVDHDVYEALKKFKDELLKVCKVKDERIGKILREREKLKECVKFYADHNIEYFGGQCARQCLKEIG